MTKHTTICPPNSVFLVAEIPDPPMSLDKATDIGSTQYCIAVGCLMEQDGPTSITLGLERDVDPGTSLAFDGLIKTPNRKVAVWTVELQKLLETDVPSTQTRVRIWKNRPNEADRVIIGLG